MEAYICAKCDQVKEKDDGFWNFRITPKLEVILCTDCYKKIVKLVKTWLKEPAK